MYVQPEIATQPGANLVTIGSVLEKREFLKNVFLLSKIELIRLCCLFCQVQVHY